MGFQKPKAAKISGLNHSQFLIQHWFENSIEEVQTTKQSIQNFGNVGGYYQLFQLQHHKNTHRTDSIAEVMPRWLKFNQRRASSFKLRELDIENVGFLIRLIKFWICKLNIQFLSYRLICSIR